MFPHERSLVKKMQGKPFVLLGIDFDPTRKVLQAAVEKEHLGWRHWFDGSDGPIGKQWNIQVIPTFYILDAHGVIRFKGIHSDSGPVIDKDVQTLLNEMEKTEENATRPEHGKS
jgi:hypothetical protein